MRILIVRSRYLCYHSAGFFADRMEEAMDRLGHEVVRLDIDEEDLEFNDLENLKPGLFDAVLDINSRLPYLQIDNGDFWLDSLEAPFFNYILDHPLYHHPGLNFPLEDYSAIGLDIKHCEYMRANYPHLRNVSCLPLSGTPGISFIPYKEREIGWLFSGTYIPQATLDREMNILCDRFGEGYRALVSDLLDAWDPQRMPLEDCLEGYLKSRGMAPEDTGYAPDFPELMNIIYPVDRIMRNRNREEILLALSKVVPVTVLGENWEYSALEGAPNIDFVAPRFYSYSLELQARARISLDINPAFYCGIHDRVTNGLANGCLCVSNMSPSFSPKLREKNEIFYYNKDSISEVAHGIEAMSLSEQEAVAESGRDIWKEEYSWDAHAKKLTDIITG